MMSYNVERLKELNEKMLDWICEHIKEDEDLFRALYGRIGFAQSELDPEIECRIYKMYQELPAKERLELKIKAEYAEFQSFWRGLSQDELVDIAEKVAIVNRLAKELPDTVTEEQAKYFVMFSEPLEAISETILNGDLIHESELVGIALEKMYNAGDGGAYYDMEDEYYEEATELTQEM